MVIVRMEVGTIIFMIPLKRSRKNLFLLRGVDEVVYFVLPISRLVSSSLDELRFRFAIEIS